MPFIYNFNKGYSKPKYINIHPKGWKPITIEYTVCQANPLDTLSSICWRVKGTTHSFTIYEQKLNQLCEGNDYGKHFEKTLEFFRKDYIEWHTDPKYAECPWVEEYTKQYGSLIEL